MQMRQQHKVYIIQFEVRLFKLVIQPVIYANAKFSAVLKK